MEKLKAILAPVLNNRIVRFLGTIIGALILVLILLNVNKGKNSAVPAPAGTSGEAVVESGSVAEVLSESAAEAVAASVAEDVASAELPADSAAVSVESAAEYIPPEGEVTITVSAAGDCTLASDDSMDYDLSFFAKYDEVGDPAWFLSNVRDVFATDDLTIVNCEGTLARSGERADKTYAFRGDPEYVKILTEGSVEAVDLANNHSFDYGEEAYEETKKVLEDAGIVSFGYDRSQVIEIKGIKIGLVGIYELESEFDCVYLMRQEIQAVKDRGAQLIIVSFHWGDEGFYETNDIQIELAREAVLSGANLVLGHHPHRVQGVDSYNGVYICYSLGNFCFGGNSSPADMDSMIFRQTFTFENGVLQDRDEHLVIPCSISSEYDYNNYRPRILEDEEGERVLEKIRDLS